ncbi:hypothetical protein N7474_001389 [Penicillium riverlandense]|uniref:uncharacterized protein n=1 Tax=Penicillium riverlandense TaxID=1903569 RepID=UPI002547D13C|nr:uncharacterized protein N7474_001389 [Penicillium riverlandense]KAJ5833078.1 hypothetical protein N7474_001389 [Penicillium riverlandense]
MPDPIPPSPSLAGKTVIITGGNTGLGFEVARQTLHLQAARVIITARSQAKGAAAVAALRADADIQSANPAAQIEFFDLDLDDYQSGLRFCQQVKKQVPELDLLLCNGGTTTFDYEISKSGHERVMQVNCYTHFFIVLELLGLLRATAAKRGSPTRVTFLASYSHAIHDLERTPIPPGCKVLDYFDSNTLTRGVRRYPNSKLTLIAFVQRLAKQQPASEVIVNSVCPGVVSTKIMSRLPAWMQLFIYFYVKFKAVPMQVGGERIVHAAVVVGAESHGQFLPMGGQMEGYSPFLDKDTGQAFKDELWTEMLEDGRLVDPAMEVFEHAPEAVGTVG